MNRSAYCLIVLTFLTGCANNWTKTDTVLMTTTTAVLIADARTTARIHNRPGIYEKGPIARQVLGRQPSKRDTYTYFGSLIIFNYILARTLPPKYRRYWLGWETIVHGLSIKNNCELELC